MNLDDLVSECRQEVASMRMGHLDWTHFYDEDTGEQRRSKCEEVIEFLRWQATDLENLMNHTCVWSSNDYCVHCGADGRA